MSNTTKLELYNTNDKAKMAVVFKRDFDAKTGKVVADKVTKGYQGGDYTNYQGAVIANLKQMQLEVNNLRRGTKEEACIDVSFGEYAQDKLGIAKDEKGGFSGLMHFLGLDPSRATIQKLMTMPEFQEEFSWLVPELVRDAVQTGFLQNPIWEEITASDTNVNQASIIVPQQKIADTPVYRLGESETIPLGSMSFDQKTITVYKVGTGIEISDEVRQFVTIDVLSEHLTAVGIAISQGLDTLAVQTLVNGDGNNNSAPVIGVENIGSFDYDNDILRLSIRMALLNYNAATIISNEDPAREILTLPELKGFAGETTLIDAAIKLGRDVPRSFQILPSAVMPTTNQLMWLDKARALHKYTSRPLFIESDRMIQSQMTISVATITTGFSKFMRDASVVMDKSLAFSGNGFPSWMDALSFMKRDWINV